MEFHENLKAARKAKGYTQLQVAEMMGITQSSYSYYELGKRCPDVAKIKMMAKVLGVTGDYLLGREEEKPSAETSEELLDMELIERLTSLTEEELPRVDAFVQGLLASR